jgi:hypothetical protein
MCHKVFPWKIDLSFGLGKKSQNLAFCETCFVFFTSIIKNIRFSRNYTNTHRILRCTCKQICWIFLKIKTIIFWVVRAYATRSRIEFHSKFSSLFIIGEKRIVTPFYVLIVVLGILCFHILAHLENQECCYFNNSIMCQ